MNGDGQQQPTSSGAIQWQSQQPALADILTALQMQLMRTAAESPRMMTGPSSVLSVAAPLMNALPTHINSTATAAAAGAAGGGGGGGGAIPPNQTPMPIPPTANPLLQSYQQLLNPAFLELQRQLIAQQTAQFRFPLLPPTQLPSSMSLPSLRQVTAATMPHLTSLSNSAAAAAAAVAAATIPARPVPRKLTAPTAPTTPLAPTAPTTPVTPMVVVSTSNNSPSGVNGSHFAIPQDPIVRKPSFSHNRPSTSEDLETLTSTPTRSTKSPEFEMGRLPTKNYIPSHFMKGTMIQMASGKLKKVEEMSSDDFLLAAPLTGEFNVDASVVVEIAKASTLARIKFSVGQLQYEATLEPQLEHPFFVLGKGWCSCDPVRTADTYGLECKELKVGDVCISLSRRSNDDAKQLDETVTLAEAAEFKNKEATKAAIREQLTKEMSESDGRSSAPPTRYHPYSKKMRKVSES